MENARYPLVSVIIPTYNDSATLREAIESVLHQTYPALETIVIDDGSDDGGETGRIGREYGERIVFRTVPNGGVASARNIGISTARGDYIAFLDADDVFCPDKTERQVRHMMDAGLSFCHASYRRCTFDGRVIDHRDTSYNAGNTYPKIIRGCVVAASTVMIRRDALGEKRFAAGTLYGEDVCLWIDLAARMAFGHIPEPLADVRVSGESAANDPAKLLLGLTNILQHVLSTPEHAGHLPEIRSLIVQMDDAADAARSLSKRGASRGQPRRTNVRRLTKPLRAARYAAAIAISGLRRAAGRFFAYMRSEEFDR